MAYDFDKVIDRQNTGSIKADYAQCKKIYKDMPRDFVPMWVADMDFSTAPAVTRAIKQRASHELYGYLSLDDEFFKSIIWWQKARHNVDMQQKDFIEFPGIVSALASCVNAFTNEGEGVIIYMRLFYINISNVFPLRLFFI